MNYRILSQTDKEMFGANVAVTIFSTDLAALGAGNTGSINIAPNETGAVNGATTPVTTNQLAAGQKVQLVGFQVNAVFTFSDGAIVNCPVTLGDAGSAARYLASNETINLTAQYSAGTGTAYVFLAAGYVIAAFTGTAAHNINTATAGSITFYLRIDDMTQWNVP